MTRWSWSTTGDEVVETFKDRVKGKTVIITGAGSGAIGSATAISIASGSPSLLILPGRTESKMYPLITNIQSQFPTLVVKFVPLDLSSLASVRAASAAINNLVDQIDILINAAGIMACPFQKSVDGIEMQFATNYVGHFLLTNLLMKKILKAKGGRVVNVSSTANSSAGIRFEDWNFEDGKVYNEWEAYGQSKTAGITFSRALATRFKRHGCFSFSLHPGYIVSDLQANMLASPEVMRDGFARAEAAAAASGRTFERETPKSQNQGAATPLIAALDPELEAQNGAYLLDGDLAANQPAEQATNIENQEKLWRLSEELVGEKFDW